MIDAHRREMTFAGVPVRELVAQYDTPLVALDLDTFALDADAFVRAFVARGITVAYAAKAFLVTAFAEVLAATPLHVDVCSLGELVTAERGGLPASRLYLHGAAKSDAELQALVDGRLAYAVIDGAEEVERLAALAAGRRVDVMLRINTGIEAHTHEFVRTGGEDTKFGVPAAQAPDVIARIASLPALQLIGLHGHIGSQILDAAPFRANLEELIRFADAARALDAPIATLNLGGGIGIEASPDEPRPFDLDALAAALAERAASTPYRLAIEPGRALVARAGTTFYRIVAIKQQGRRRFVIVDGGMNDNPRPLLYGARHAAEVAVSAATGPLAPATLAGRSCENDEIGEYDLPSDLAPGDVIAMRSTGAYTFSMASNYNRFGKPAVVFVRDGSHRRVVRRESADDVLRCDVG